MPFFDESLPLEVVVQVFRYLTVRDLMRCCLVSKEWRRAATDDHLWKSISRRLGWPTRAVGATSWKVSCDQWATHFIELKQRWLERTCRVDILEGRTAKIDLANQAPCLVHVAQHGDMIVGGYTDGVVKLWDREARETAPLHNFDVSPNNPLGAGGISSLAVSGDFIFAGTSLGHLSIWSVLDFEVAFEAELPTEVAAIHVGSKGDRLVVVSGSMFSLFGLTAQGEWAHNGERVGQADFSVSGLLPTSGDSDLIITGSTDHFSLPVQLWDATTGLLRYPLNANLDRLTCFESLGDRLLIGTSEVHPHRDGRLGVYSTDSGVLISPLGNSTACHSSLNARDSPPNLVAGGTFTGPAHVYDLRTMGTAMTLYGHRGKINMVQMDDYKLVTANDDARCTVFDVRKGSPFWQAQDMYVHAPYSFFFSFFFKQTRSVSSAAVKYARFSENFLVTHSIDKQLEEMTSWHSPYSLARLTVYNFNEGVANSKVNKEFTSSYVVEPSGSAVSIIMQAPYDELEN